MVSGDVVSILLTMKSSGPKSNSGTFYDFVHISYGLERIWKCIFLAARFTGYQEAVSLDIN